MTNSKTKLEEDRYKEVRATQKILTVWVDERAGQSPESAELLCGGSLADVNPHARCRLPESHPHASPRRTSPIYLMRPSQPMGETPLNAEFHCGVAGITP